MSNELPEFVHINGQKYIREDVVDKKVDNSFHEGYEQAREVYKKDVKKLKRKMFYER